MRKTAEKRMYQPTEAKYKGGAQEMYVTYDLEQETRGGGHATYPRVKRVYIAGDVKGWHLGDFQRRTGREVHGVKVDYEQSRGGYHRGAYTARRGGTTYQVPPTDVKPTTQRFSQVVEVPQEARNVKFHVGTLPEKYRPALQDVR
jgi:hypothetical protein